MGGVSTAFLLSLLAASCAGTPLARRGGVGGTILRGRASGAAATRAFFDGLFELKRQRLPNDVREEIKTQLREACRETRPNGINASPTQRAKVNDLVDVLEGANPTGRPALSPLMYGFWRMLYTDFSPAAPSSGQLGPFVGDVYQDLSEGIIKNILVIPPLLKGALVANQRVRDPNTWEIEFDRVGNMLGPFKLPTKQFEPGDQIRLWEIVYLDDDLRIMRARRAEKDSMESFVFVLERDASSVEVDV
eukprot:jgi/Bigna1/143017/aug1.75_g17725